jgi:hypothetical protein
VLNLRGLHMWYTKLLISISILLIIGLHTLPAMQKLQGKDQTFWPLMAWGMYRNSRDPGPIRATVSRIIGETSKGEKKLVDAKLVGLSFYALQRLYWGPMWAGDSSAAQRLADRLNLEREDPFAGFRLEKETQTISDAGIVKEENPVITYRVAR